MLGLHAYYKGRMFPIAFFFTKKKSGASYEKLLENFTIQCCAKYRLTFKPETILSDFEIALFTAFAKEYPTAKIKGCYFHYTQCIYKQVN